MSKEVDFSIQISYNSLFKNLIMHFNSEDIDVPIAIKEDGLIIQLEKIDEDYKVVHHVFLNKDNMKSYYVNPEYVNTIIVLDFSKFVKNLKSISKDQILGLSKDRDDSNCIKLEIHDKTQIASISTIGINSGDIPKGEYFIPDLTNEKCNKIVVNECMKAFKHCNSNKNLFVKLEHSIIERNNTVKSVIQLKTDNEGEYDSNSTTNLYVSRQYDEFCRTECSAIINPVTSKVLSKIGTFTVDQKAIIKFYFDLEDQVIIKIPLGTSYGEYLILLEKKAL
jgi:hypothetical protein